MSTPSAIKRIITVLPSTQKHWVGDGFNVHPTFGAQAFSKAISPFLMLDYAAPKTFPATSKRLGVGQHPHRGFETVTIAFEGEVEHADSTGGSGVIGTGDVQWMTAGRGIVHEEFHSTAFAKRGGVFEMVQLWVNLPAKHKMTPPQYQPITKEEINEVALSDGRGTVRVIAGSFEGNRGPATTFTPIDLWDIKLEKEGVPLTFDLPTGHNTMVLVRQGGISVQGTAVGGQTCALLGTEGTHVVIVATVPQTEVLLLSGEPIHEPIASRGPFVMNTEEELTAAMMDYHSGNFGK